jgi:4'-phosphopantetheinyl transferase
MEKPTMSAVLYPVVLVVPETIAAWTGRRRVVALSRLARAAARQSARRLGCALGRLAKDSDGVPLPVNGLNWSVTHKPSLVAGVAGPAPLGIDIEPVRPRTPKLFSKIAGPQEWALGKEDEWHLFYRFWTAKEAVLKALGIGMTGLSDCRVVAIDDPFHLTLDYRGNLWQVQQSMACGHVASVTQRHQDIHWVWPKPGH